MRKIDYKSSTWLCDLLKNCPCGRKFYSPLFGKEVTFTNRADKHLEIAVDDDEYFLEGDGAYNQGGECMLLPAKGCHKSDWEEFCYYIMKEGDYVVGDIKVWGEPVETVFKIEREYGELMGRGSDGYSNNITNPEGKFQLNIFRFATQEEIEKYERAKAADDENAFDSGVSFTKLEDEIFEEIHDDEVADLLGYDMYRAECKKIIKATLKKASEAVTGE